MLAKSPTIAVSAPITANETKKDNHPPQIAGGGTNANSYLINKYNPNKYWYTPGVGYPVPYSYGAGTVNPGPPDASANTGSAGAPYSITHGRSGSGGSGLFMIRYKLY